LAYSISLADVQAERDANKAVSAKGIHRSTQCKLDRSVALYDWSK
jgi:hypothetical protein